MTTTVMVEEELEITKTQEDPDDNMTSNPGFPFKALLIQPHSLSIIQQKFKISFKHKRMKLKFTIRHQEKKQYV